MNRGIWNASKPLTTYLNAQPTDVINVYIGGQIRTNVGELGNCNTALNLDGVTCGGANTQMGGSCPWNGVEPGRSTQAISFTPVAGHDAILLSSNFPHASNPQHAFAHELGHFLGLTHSPFTFIDHNGVPQPLEQCLSPNDTAGVANLLMGAGSSSPAPVLTPSQCRRARCVTARWLESFASSSPASTARREAVCAE